MWCFLSDLPGAWEPVSPSLGTGEGTEPQGSLAQKEARTQDHRGPEPHPLEGIPNQRTDTSLLVLIRSPCLQRALSTEPPSPATKEGRARARAPAGWEFKEESPVAQPGLQLSGHIGIVPKLNLSSLPNQERTSFSPCTHPPPRESCAISCHLPQNLSL